MHISWTFAFFCEFRRARPEIRAARPYSGREARRGPRKNNFRLSLGLRAKLLAKRSTRCKEGTFPLSIAHPDARSAALRRAYWGESCFSRPRIAAVLAPGGPGRAAASRAAVGRAQAVRQAQAGSGAVHISWTFAFFCEFRRARPEIRAARPYSGREARRGPRKNNFRLSLGLRAKLLAKRSTRCKEGTFPLSIAHPDARSAALRRAYWGESCFSRPRIAAVLAPGGPGRAAASWAAVGRA